MEGPWRSGQPLTGPTDLGGSACVAPLVKGGAHGKLSCENYPGLPRAV